MKPTVGRIVHYTDHAIGDREKDQPFAAIITYAEYIPYRGSDQSEDSYRIALTIFDTDGIRWLREVNYSDYPLLGHWSWPERV